MSEINDLKAYKLAKTVVRDMATIIPRVQACIIFLEPYKAYNQVAPILDQLNVRLDLLKAQNTRQKAILERKGERQ
jgi:hypothetical protein